MMGKDKRDKGHQAIATYDAEVGRDIASCYQCGWFEHHRNSDDAYEAAKMHEKETYAGALKTERDILLKAAKWGAKASHHPACGVARQKSLICDCYIGALQIAVAMAEGRAGSKLPYEKPRIIEEFFPEVAA